MSELVSEICEAGVTETDSESGVGARKTERQTAREDDDND